MKTWATSILAVAACVLLAPNPAVAVSKALLIGVGTYELPNNDLPGIDLDIDNMKKVAQIMGFAPAQTKVLFDDQATYANVKDALATWAHEGVGPNDRVLIYFSGHGARVLDPRPDKAGSIDDALVLHDVQLVHVNGKSSLGHVLMGHEFGTALAAIPSKNILVLIDACHSGTATRSLSLGNLRLGESSGMVKYFNYPGAPVVTQTRAITMASGAENYAALSAARDDEYALATSHGGLFTLGVVDAIQAASRDSEHPTVEQLRATTAKYIETHTDEQSRHHPVTDGSPRLIKGALDLIPLQNGQGPTWQALATLVAKAEPLSVTTGATEVKVGDEVTLETPLPRAGFLNVVAIDSQDRATVLYPNKFAPDNAVAAGRFRFPTASMDFVVRAAEPLGPTLVVAFLTDKKVNLLDLGVEGRDAAGKLQQTFTEVTALATRALVVEARQHAGFAAGSLTMTVKANAP
jgi:hypothetical protein